MTNPNNAIGTNGAFGGRTSVNAFNDGLNAWMRGVMSGWACVPDSGMTVAIGGDPDTRDVAVAEDDAGNKTSINNISMAPVKVTIPGAPASNTRIDSIVAYVDNPPQGSSTITDNYEACGLIVVSGTASSSPTAPNESTIRSAITADGATGATAYYVVLANVSVANGTTDITSGEISAGDIAGIGSTKIADGAVTSDKIENGAINASKIDFSTLGGNYSTTETNTNFTWIDGKPIYKKTVNFGTLPNAGNKKVAHGISNMDYVVKYEGMITYAGDNTFRQIPHISPATITDQVLIEIDPTDIAAYTGTDRSTFSAIITIYYTKTTD